MGSQPPESNKRGAHGLVVAWPGTEVHLLRPWSQGANTSANAPRRLFNCHMRCFSRRMAPHMIPIEDLSSTPHPHPNKQISRNAFSKNGGSEAEPFLLHKVSAQHPWIPPTNQPTNPDLPGATCHRTEDLAPVSDPKVHAKDLGTLPPCQALPCHNLRWPNILLLRAKTAHGALALLPRRSPESLRWNLKGAGLSHHAHP